MWYKSEMVLRNYIPETITSGMFFIIRSPSDENVIPPQLWQIPSIGFSQEGYDDLQDFFDKNGYPVELYIIDPTDGEILASPDMIGWFDDGDSSDEYRDIEINDINLIFKYYEGRIEIEINETDSIYGATNVIVEEGKIIIRPL
jgi:hypothetical protein